MSISRSSLTGALIGCAVGDALGAPFEGLWAQSIPSQHELLAGFHEYHGYPCGQFTDDTQLTIATVESMIEQRGINPADIAARIAELWRHGSVIGPGGACTAAAEHFLATGDWQAMGAAEGQAGNGTAMRAPLLGLCTGDREIIAGICRLTHTDARSVAGGVAVAEAARYLAEHPEPWSVEQFTDRVAEATRPWHADLANLIIRLPQVTTLEEIAWAGQNSPELAEPIITPFIIPTVLASLWSVIRHPESWSDAVAFAIGLGGDVDTLGAIVGAMAGAAHGLDAIPAHLVATVQESKRLHILSAQLHALLPF